MISVIVPPDCWGTDYWGTGEEDGDPWDRLDRVKERCRPLGISLEYNPPSLSKEAWLQHTKDYEETSG